MLWKNFQNEGTDFRRIFHSTRLAQVQAKSHLNALNYVVNTYHFSVACTYSATVPKIAFASYMNVALLTQTGR